MSAGKNEKTRTARELFLAALEQPAMEREAWLRGACANDPSLLQKVQAILRSHEEDSFLERPAMEMTSTVTLPGSNPMELPGDRIGRYKLLEKIGEGGCGVVYMAEQESPLRRRVALKIIKPGMDSKSVIARFEAERQALAMMDHPYIAKVLEAGATESGRPYFAMELVRGIRITDYCEQRNLSTGERLNLFLQVCQAVQHAHQKGIIHRDLKPSNILVTENDGKPAPKVIDFGIAKATEQKLTDKTLFTQFAQFIGTPAYMSPEQAAMTILDIDTRSDIYSLGVLLYELLTGTTPFDAQELAQAGFDEMRRIIRETEPEKPSTRLATRVPRRKGEREKGSREAGAMLESTSTLNPQLKALSTDLDWIVMKALEKDRTRRYETANGLAADIQRHLSNEPVTARPPDNLYRLQKLVRRNKVVFVAVAAVITALVMGLAVSLWLFVRESRARERAILAEREQSQLRQEAERARAEEARLRQQAQASEQTARAEAAKSDEVARFLTDLFESFRLSENLDKAEETVTEVLLASSEQWSYYGRILNVRAGLRAQQGKWNEAAKDVARAVELEPTNHHYYHWLAPLLVQSGDLVGYHKIRQSILKVFGNTDDPVVAERMAKDCLILPLSGPDLEVVNRWVNFAVAAGTDHWAWIFFQHVKALAEYRQGHFTGTVDWAGKVLTRAGESNELALQAYLLLAMAHHQLNHPDAARAALAKGVGIAERKLPQLESGNIRGGWNDWIIAQALLREARALIEGPFKGSENQSEPVKEAFP